MIDRLISHIRRTVESQYNKNEKKKKDKNRKKKNGIRDTVIKTIIIQ